VRARQTAGSGSAQRRWPPSLRLIMRQRGRQSSQANGPAGRTESWGEQPAYRTNQQHRERERERESDSTLHWLPTRLAVAARTTARPHKQCQPAAYTKRTLARSRRFTTLQSSHSHSQCSLLYDYVHPVYASSKRHPKLHATTDPNTRRKRKQIVLCDQEQFSFRRGFVLTLFIACAAVWSESARFT